MAGVLHVKSDREIGFNPLGSLALPFILACGN